MGSAGTFMLLRGCLQREASADCAEEHSISPWITPVYRLYSAHATRTGPIQNLTRQFASSAQTLDKELRTTTGEVGFKRISAVFH